MSIELILSIFLAACIGSLLSGMLGIGGAIVNYPLLLYIPVVFGFEGFTSHQVSGIVAVQVFFSTLVGVLSYKKGGYLNKNLISTMGISILISSFIGGYFSQFLSDEIINVVYGFLAIFAVILMLVPDHQDNIKPNNELLQYDKLLAVFFSIFIGLGAGIVGAGGAFLLVPVMLSILKVPTRITIATSLGVTFISSIGTTMGKVLTGEVLLIPSIIVIIASLTASPLGAKFGKIIYTKYLRILLAILIFITTIKIWFDIIF